MANDKYKCVTLKGELENLGKHILLPFGCTLCGVPTIHCDASKFTALNHPAFADIISEYIEEKEWDITCTRCLDIFDLIDNEAKVKQSKLN